MQNTLVIGYGNIDRQDDGVAWHVLAALARLFNQPVPDDPDESFQFPVNLVDSTPANQNTQATRSIPNPAYHFSLQLLPEMAEMLAGIERVCFVDAHTGNIPEDVQFTYLQASYQRSPFTHHMTPETMLAFAQNLYGYHPQAILVSIRGYEFGFDRRLSKRTAGLVGQAVEQIMEWLFGPGTRQV